MTANVPIVLVQFLALAFFVVIAIGIVLGWYAARSLKRAEQMQLATAETPATVTAYEAPSVTDSAVESID
jgi:NhaP-type Na+/H+ or K+/H+ antiporter